MTDLPVVNTSPLIYLARAGFLPLLQIAGSRVAVPSAVADEIRAWPTADAAARALDSLTWLQLVPDEAVPPSILAWKLGAGEAAVLTWASTRPGTTVIVDDLASRRCASALGIPCRGTLGLVLSAKRRGVIPLARPVLMQLINVGMYLSAAIADTALGEVGE